MTRHDKLMDRALANPQKIRFDDACRIAKALGFAHDSGRGSHCVFKRPGEIVQLIEDAQAAWIEACQASGEAAPAPRAQAREAA